MVIETPIRAVRGIGLHQGCGGRLIPEDHPKLVFNQRTKTVMIKGSEVIGRCDRCGKVGVAV